MIANVQHWTELISKKLSNNIRPEEDRMLEAWIARDPEHLAYYEELAAVWQKTARRTPEALPEPDFAGLEKEISGARRLRIRAPRAVSRKTLVQFSAAAAILLLCVLGGIWLTKAPEVVSTEVIAEALDQDVRRVQLPDGSTVFLRRGGTLTYDQNFTERTVALTGEGFFDVVHDESSPFTISAGNGSVRVLGTRFNVKAEEGSPVELYVEQGRVAFSPASDVYEAKIFSDGQAGFIDPAGVTVERSSPPGPNATSWISGTLIFDHATLDHVIRDLSRHFSVDITVADSALYACELKADFMHQPTLDNVLQTLEFILNLNIEKSGDKYILSGEPCKPTDDDN